MVKIERFQSSSHFKLQMTPIEASDDTREVSELKIMTVILCYALN